MSTKKKNLVIEIIERTPEKERKLSISSMEFDRPPRVYRYTSPNIPLTLHGFSKNENRCNTDHTTMMKRKKQLSVKFVNRSEKFKFMSEKTRSNFGRRRSLSCANLKDIEREEEEVKWNMKDRGMKKNRVSLGSVLSNEGEEDGGNVGGRRGSNRKDSVMDSVMKVWHKRKEKSVEKRKLRELMEELAKAKAKLDRRFVHRIWKNIAKGIGCCQVFQGSLFCIMAIVVVILIIIGVVLGIGVWERKTLNDETTYFAGKLDHIFEDFEHHFADFTRIRTVLDSYGHETTKYEDYLSPFSFFHDKFSDYHDFDHSWQDLFNVQFGYILRISSSDKEDFLENIRVEDCSPRCDAYQDFEITQLSFDGENYVPRNTRFEYFPLTFLESLDGNEDILGLDLSSISGFGELIDESIYCDCSVASPVRRLFTKSDSFGFVYLVPIYDSDIFNFSQTASEDELYALRVQYLRGFEVGIIEAKDSDNLEEFLEGKYLLEVEDDEGYILFSNVDKPKNSVQRTHEIELGRRKFQLKFYWTSPLILKIFHRVAASMCCASFAYLSCCMMFLFCWCRVRRNQDYKEKSQLVVKYLNERTKILENIIPKQIVEKFLELGSFAELKKGVTIVFIDICGFTNFCGGATPANVIDFLNNFLVVVDHCCDIFGVFKIKSLGDGIMACKGVFGKRDDKGNCKDVCLFALSLRKRLSECMLRINRNIRVGIHSGKVIAGIVGLDKPLFDIFGQTVNISSRMESCGICGRIQVSEQVKKLMENDKSFVFIKRKNVPDIKGLGKVNLYLLEDDEEYYDLENFTM